MATILLRHQLYSARVRVPIDMQEHYGGKAFLQRTLGTSDKKLAKVEAGAWEAALRMEWAVKRGTRLPSSSIRSLYNRLRRSAESGEYEVHIDGWDPVQAGIDFEIEKIADKFGDDDLPLADHAKLAALQDALSVVQGKQPKPRRELEPAFRDLADDYMVVWRTKQGSKKTNTEQQKLATYDLFEGYWGVRPIREVTRRDAALFVDALRQLDPLWAKSPKGKGMSWAELQKAFGGRPKGLAAATINRHMATLQSLWTWANERDYCTGTNPFSGFQTKLSEGKNVSGYQRWEPEELEKLFSPPPKRADVAELMMVAMFTGMRLDEIASLTWADIKSADGITYINVEDAKTSAGNRRVPLHPRLEWLKARAVGKTGRVWPQFNPEGPGKKAGADAGKEFSRLKLARGFTDRTKVFHSFRNNVVGQLEERGVAVTEIAQLVGHEKPFTLKKYSKQGLPLARLAEIVKLIDYPKLTLPVPSAAPAKAPAA